MTRAPARRCGVGSFDYCFRDCCFERDPADCSNEGASYLAVPDNEAATMKPASSEEDPASLQGPAERSLPGLLIAPSSPVARADSNLSCHSRRRSSGVL